MKLRNLFLMVFVLFIAQISFAQEKFFSVNISSKDSLNNFKIYLSPLHHTAGRRATELKLVDGNHYAALVPESKNSFYSVVVVKNNSQLFTTLYLPCDVDTVSVDMCIDGYYILSNNSKENSALCEYQRIVGNCNRDIWNVDAANIEQARSMLEGLILAADSIKEGCAEPVKEYLKLWSYTSIYNLMYSVKRMAKNNLSFTEKDITGDVAAAFDCDIAAVFPETNLVILSSFPKGASLVEKMEHLYNSYNNEIIRRRVSESLLDSFLKNYDYSADFEGGLNQLKAIVEKYNMDNRYLSEYESRRATIKGTPFPQGVQLKDINGNMVDFSTFKGKYVYIDMWASWCAPCRREIPYLKTLEAELDNENVVFVSISIDTNKEAWKKSVAEHELHGHQLIDSENKLGSALNVRGIPFFVIYDKDGCLYMYDAPRPSSGTPLKEMLKGLK